MPTEVSLSRSLLAVISAEMHRLETMPLPLEQDDKAYLATALASAEHCLREALAAAATQGLDVERISEAIRRCGEHRLRVDSAIELGAIDQTRKTNITRLLERPDAPA